MTRFLPAKTASAPVTVGPVARSRGPNPQFMPVPCERRATRSEPFVVSVIGARQTCVMQLVSVVLFRGLPPRFRPRRFR